MRTRKESLTKRKAMEYAGPSGRYRCLGCGRAMDYQSGARCFDCYSEWLNQHRPGKRPSRVMSSWIEEDGV